ncbi:MAG: hypothetical protein L6435_01635 [Anaerolineae bacterium]|nr:hypothetical protein [Anaerolineae bacterium]
MEGTEHGRENQRVLFSIGQDFSAADGFLAYYDRPADRVYLSDDEGTGWIGGFAPGSAQTIENSRAILHLVDMSAMGEGNLLTATWSITFKSPVVGEKHIYLDVVDAEDVSSGWQQMGDWTVFSPIPVVPRWNLISIPASPESTAVDDVFSTIDGQYDQVCAYDAVMETWNTYQVGGPPEGNTLANIDETMGFWIRATASAELTLGNCSSSTASIELYVGWNLIGYPSGTTRPISEALAGIAGKYDMVCAYDATDAADPWKRYDTGVTSVFNDLAEMGPGRGYWVHALESCLWSPGAAPEHSKAVRSYSTPQDSPDSGVDLAPPPLPLRLGGE